MAARTTAAQIPRRRQRLAQIASNPPAQTANIVPLGAMSGLTREIPIKMMTEIANPKTSSN
ncbi:MAG: hypothetical protein MJ025_02235 [Victivallaceae bacterium]|nr:hypothetical protein [Victivallaceae bacterium]